MFLSLNNKIETKIIDLKLSLTKPLPNAPRLGKSFKVCFSN